MTEFSFWLDFPFNKKRKEKQSLYIQMSSLCLSKGAKGQKGQSGDPGKGLPGHDGHQGLRGGISFCLLFQ